MSTFSGSKDVRTALLTNGRAIQGGNRLLHQRHRSLSDLPLELLHRIVRFLPPKTCFTILPRLSRRLDAAARTAIPEYSQGRLVVLCTLVLRQTGWWEAEMIKKNCQRLKNSLDTQTFLPVFEPSHVKNWTKRLEEFEVTLRIGKRDNDLIKLWPANLMPVIWQELGGKTDSLISPTDLLMILGGDLRLPDTAKLGLTEFANQHIDLTPVHMDARPNMLLSAANISPSPWKLVKSATLTYWNRFATSAMEDTIHRKSSKVNRGINRSSSLGTSESSTSNPIIELQRRYPFPEATNTILDWIPRALPNLECVVLRILLVVHYRAFATEPQSSHNALNHSLETIKALTAVVPLGCRVIVKEVDYRLKFTQGVTRSSQEKAKVELEEIDSERFPSLPDGWRN
ncbi:hypothetical protein M427DRAFT_48866 [Gonapodya prolifera JEL478]|uniref:F-box domain-containing protein n=1 Tax=Gonapodya prolifera (strain JEL478) TaxID=1344416 RepID=A0A138ZZM4_GONPJ|nr:hypothetical protein M427DRAFT_48866 [Gonapodya prolifera JEL478]|eukprot:KXS09962.1 hypothetical protein M427DRAFT_48866 [Gonapodya prolifera JEL478]